MEMQTSPSILAKNLTPAQNTTIMLIIELLGLMMSKEKYHHHFQTFDKYSFLLNW